MSKIASATPVLTQAPVNGTLVPGLAPVHQWLPALLPGTWTTLGPYLVGYVSILPGAAETVLRRHNGQNRRLDPRTAKKYAKDLLQGKWMLNGETILFDDSGLLRQGQHRLQACVLSGVTLPSFVIAGVPASVYASLDLHRKRQPAEVLAGQGVKCHRAVASAASTLHKFFGTGRIARQHGYGYHLSMWEITDVFRTNPGLEASAVFAKDLGNTVHLFYGHGHVTALHYIFSVANKPLADEMFSRLRNRNIPDDASWSALRLLAGKLGDNKASRNKLPDADLTGLVVKAWNALYEGRNLSSLRLSSSDGYPHVAGIAYAGDLPVVPLEADSFE